VDFPLHQRAERIIHQAMSLHCLATGEARRDDGEPEMAAAAPGAGMAGMFCRVVDDFDATGSSVASLARMASITLMISGIPA
jgi:hypothetical protein